VIRRVVALVAAFVVLGVLAVGCGSPKRLDAGVLERNLPSQLVADHPEVVTDVACPRPIKKQAGLEVQCTAAIGGSPVVVTVTQLDDNGALRAVLDKPLLDVTASAATLAARLSKDLGVATTIECAGPAVRVLVVGEELSCTARDPSLRSRTITVTVLDDAGTLDAAIS
jgi:hypothetical protein